MSGERLCGLALLNMDVSRENILKRFSSAGKDILQLCHQVLKIVHVGAY